MQPETALAPVPASEPELNRLLEADPRSVLLNIRKADWRAQARDDDVACYFYKRALRLAADRSLAQAEADELHRAERALAGAAGRAYARREKRLTERGLPPQQWSPRLRASLDPSADRRPCAQDPTHHHYPGLPEIEFYDPGQFAWAPAVEAATAAISEELIALLARGTDEFSPFTPDDMVCRWASARRCARIGTGA